MSIDRRIVSILYYNNINDVNMVEKFIGINKENYYEVIINGKVEKLKIPGKEYFEKVQEEVKLDSPKPIKTKKKQIEKLETLDSFTNNLKDVVEVIKKSESELFTTTIVTEIKEIPKDEEFSFEEELKKTEVENNEVLEKINEKEIKIKKPKFVKKSKNVSTKKLDDDIDDFIDSI
jgi:hypothetical protein